MASIPQEQFITAYYAASRVQGRWHTFGRGYELYVKGKFVKLTHYGTTIYEYDPKKRKVSYGGAYSMSDVNAINSMAYLTGKGGAYLQGGKIYAEGTGPRYKTKKKAAPFGL